MSARVGRAPLWDEPRAAEQRVDDQRGQDHRHEHQGGDPQRERPCRSTCGRCDHDRQHDQVGEDERHHAGEGDPARPQHGRERDVADRAHEAQHGDHRADEDVLQSACTAAGVREEEAVEEVVAEQADEAGQQEAGRDLLPEHLPVAAEVVRDVRPGRAEVSRCARSSARRPCGADGPSPRLGMLARVPPAAARRRPAAARPSTRSGSIPPTNSASANCHPISTQMTIPSSITRFVEANWNASAEAAEAPFWNRLLAIAIAA